MNKNLNFIKSAIYFLIAYLSFLVVFSLISSQKFTTATSKQESKKDFMDSRESLVTNNENYRKGLEANSAGNKEEALKLLMESKKGAVSVGQKATVDFTVSTVVFDINRASGTDAFIEISKNTNYPNRTRALAMLRAYFLYLKYRDENLLKKLAVEYDITWTNSSEITLKYMNIVYNLYPFAPAIIRIVDDKLDMVKNKEEGITIFNKYKDEITSSIKEMSQNNGELTETTSSMLGYSNLLGRMYLNFGGVSKKEVEDSYESLINLDQLHNIQTNKQYTLIAYANFESGAKDYAKAESVLNILIAREIHPALKEALPKVDIKTKYPYLLILKNNTKNEAIKSFIATIGSNYKK